MRLKEIPALVLVVVLGAGAAPGAETNLVTSIQGDQLSINGGETRLGAQNWAEPEKTWRTVGELIKSAVPPADASGRRAGVTLVVSLDAKAPWGALKSLLLAAAGLGIPQAKLNHGKPGNHDLLALPGADPGAGTLLAFPLADGEGEKVLTENGGRKMEVTPVLAQGLVKQQPKATVALQIRNALPAVKALVAIRVLQEVKAAGVAFLPVKEISSTESAAQQEAKDAVDRAFQGGLGGLGK